MAVNEKTLESFISSNITVLDEIIGTDASELKNILNSATISGMESSDILNKVTASSSASAQRALINTRLNTYSRVATNTMMKDAPTDTKYVYVGPIDEKTRDECLQYASAGALTESEIINNGWTASLVDGGGFNCRHKWEIASDEGIKFFEGKQAQKVIKQKTSIKKPTAKFSNTKQADDYIKNVSLKDMTKEQRKSIKEYSKGGQLTDVINYQLRTSATLGEGARRVVKRLNSSLDKLPSYNNDVYRGISFPNMEEAINFIKNIKVGQTITELGFTSTSIKQGVALEFLRTNKAGFLFKIKSKNGKWIGELSDFQEELEVLFKSGSIFKVKKMHDIRVLDSFTGKYEEVAEIVLEEI